MGEQEWAARRCPVTGELLSSGEFVSQSAVNKLVTAVSDLPELMADLEYAAGGLRSGEAVASGVASSREPVNLSLMLEVGEMAEALHVWAQALTSFVMGPRYSVRRGDWRLIRRCFVAYRDRISGWVEAPLLVDEVVYAVRRLERLASPLEKGLRFVGRCAGCGEELMALPSAFAVECLECGTITDVEAARHRMLEEAGRLELPRPRAVEVAQILVGRPIPDATVRSWCKRSRLLPVPVPGRRLYRPADIVALVEAEAEAARRARRSSV